MARLAGRTAPVRITGGAASGERSDLRPRRLSPLLVAAMLAWLLAGLLAQAAHAEPTWTTYHRDPGRSGNDPDAVEPIVPVKAWQSPDLGASIFGQPLVLGPRVYVATARNKIYALDASSGEIVWKKSAGTPVPSGKLPCGNIAPTVGIVGDRRVEPGHLRRGRYLARYARKSGTCAQGLQAEHGRKCVKHSS